MCIGVACLYLAAKNNEEDEVFVTAVIYHNLASALTIICSPPILIVGSFRVKSSRVPHITDSDLLQILHSCYVPGKRKLSTYFFGSMQVMKIQVVKV